MPDATSRNQEEVNKLLEDLPIIQVVCGFPEVDLGMGDKDFAGVIERRLAKVKIVFDLVEKWKRRL